MRRTLLALLLCLSAPAALVACGAEDVASDATPEDVARAAERTSTAGGARFVVDGTFRAPDETVRLTGNGVEDEKGNAELQFEFSAAGEDVRIRQVIAGETIFMSGNVFQTELPAGKEWLKIDLRKAADDLGLSGLPQTGSSDPREFLRNLRAVGDVEKLGEEDVRGVATTHYQATVELRRLPEQVEPSERPAARRSVERLIELTGKETQETEVWIDEEEFVRRIQMEFSMRGADDKQTDGDMTIEYVEFGKPVSIEVPSDREAVDVSDLLKGAKKQSRSS